MRRIPASHVGGDVTDATHDELTAGGPDQSPYLVDTDRSVTMDESDDTVDYLETQDE